MTNAPIRVAIQMLWSAGAPDGTSYEIDDGVSRDTKVTLSVANAPFDAALDAFCQAAGLEYEVEGKVYRFTSQERAGKITVNRIGDRVSWKLSNADPIEALEQVLQAFSRRADIKPQQSPDTELAEQAKIFAEALQRISQLPAGEQAARTKELKNEAERYIKPPRTHASGTSKSLTTQDNQLTLSEALDVLAEAGGFLWFRSDDKFIVRNSTTAEKVRQIFQQAKVWEALRK